MGVRKSASQLSPDEMAAFLEAVMRLKSKPAPGQTDISVYDQLTVLHGAVMAVVTPTSGNGTVNFAHGNIAFLPWHRQYLRVFEAALDAEVPGVTVPYWDWADDLGAVQSLFTPEFLGARHWGNPQALTDGVLQFSVPTGERPSWWPAALPGFRINDLLEEGQGRALRRGGTESTWPPSRAWLRALIEVDQSLRGAHPLWVFWLILEQGINQLPQTHNAGHRFIGGHMGGAFSPNDPIFWMHHANVDRLWDAWQQQRIDTGLSADHDATWPAPGERSPFDGRMPPEGHNRGDGMWPWLADTTNYSSAAVSLALRNRLPIFAGQVQVEDVLDSATFGVSYAAPTP